MSRAINRYKADLRHMRFLLFEQFRLQDLLGEGGFEDWGQDEVEAVIDGLYKWACEVIGPLNGPGDAQGCRIEDGRVKTPDGFPEAWRSLYESGWRSLSVAEEYGGQDGPYTLQCLGEELMSGANTAFGMYPGLTHGAAEVIAEFGTPAQKEALCGPMFEGQYAGTMCLTEPHAGSDVGANTTRATRLEDGRYAIQGTKIFISGGDHDLAENVIHLVLARTEDAPGGTRGLSLFIVPRDRLDGSGANDVTVSGIEHKMGMNASATCVLDFGDEGECVGELLGTEEQRGIRQMFRLMNFARIGVGIQGLAIASSAYLNALDYAKERKQGASVRTFKDPDAPKVAIIEHPDVRRMLIDMKSRVEGIRALAIKLAMHADRQHLAQRAGDDAAAVAYHKGQIDLLVPLLKAYASDQAFQVCATAIQVFGGAGYLEDHPVEQYCRDAKIFSIYEGTNHIQALDLVGRKLASKGGSNLRAFIKDVTDFVAAHKDDAELGAEVTRLGLASTAMTTTAGRLLTAFQSDRMELVPLAANRVLEMMAELTVAWLLLEGAIIAREALLGLADGHKDREFYQGQMHSALYFVRNVLPGLMSKAEILAQEDSSALDIPDGAFATV